MTEPIMIDSQALVERWTSSFEQVLKWADNRPATRRNALANRLPLHLAVIELAWAHPNVKEACRMRADMIVSEIGWPKKEWLAPRVEAEVVWRNAIHSWLYGDGPKPSARRQPQ